MIVYIYPVTYFEWSDLLNKVCSFFDDYMCISVHCQTEGYEIILNVYTAINLCCRI